MAARLLRPVATLLVAAAALAADTVPRGPHQLHRGLALAFEPNYGQTAPEIVFLARGPDYAVVLKPDEVLLQLGGRGLLRLRLAGAAPAARAFGEEPLPGRSNYLAGSDRSRWKTGIPHFRRVRFAEVYPGIDIEYYGDRGRLEFDFVVKPGADPDLIRLIYDGIDRLRLDGDGALVLTAGGGELRQQPPVVFQDDGRRRRAVKASYVAKAGREVAIALGDYDRRAPLRIDPVLVYSTYLGGDTAVTGASDYARAVAVDTAGNVYIAGGTQSSAFPTSEGVFGRSFGGGSTDAFVVKISAAGTLVYSTYLGTSASEEAYGIAVDASGFAWVAGHTDARNFPVTADALQNASGGGRDLFLAKIAPDGRSLAYATYLGGSGVEEMRGLARDAAGNLWLVGRTDSANFPIRGSALQSAFSGGSMDGFAAKLDPSGKNLLYATYLGGSGWDEANGVAVDAAGNAYVTGYTSPSGFPVSVNAWRKTAEGSDAFAVKFDGSAAVVYSTLLGGNGSDRGAAIAVDGEGVAYVVGSTGTMNLPVSRPPLVPPSGAGPLQGLGLLQSVFEALKLGSHGGGTDGFVMALSPDGSTVSKMCYLGGEGYDAANAIAVDPGGDLFVAGETQSRKFWASADATFKGFRGGTSDGFLVRLRKADLSRLHSTYYGGSGDDRILALALDASGGLYATGSTSSMDFPATAGLLPLSQRTAGTDGFLAKWLRENMSAAYSIVAGGSGGSTAEEAKAIAVDSQGCVYLAGVTYSTNFPVTPGAIQASPGGGEQADIFVTKIDPAAGNLVYSTYLGGPGTEAADGIAVDASGAAYVSGYASGDTFSGATYFGSARAGAFVAKLNPRGDALEFVSILGPTLTNATVKLALDAAGSPYLFGATASAGLPVTPGAPQSSFGGGARDTFVAKLSPSGKEVIYCTYLGGSGFETPWGITVDAGGHAYVAGGTDSRNFPVTAGALRTSYGGAAEDGFVTKLNPTGTALIYSTYLGASGADSARAIAVDSSGHAWVAGTTSSPGFPMTPGPFQTDSTYPTGFLSKLRPDGSGVVWSGRFADNPDVLGLAVDLKGQAYVTGSVQSSQFPVTEDAWQIGFGGATDGFLVQFDAAFTKILYATFFGGAGADRGNAVAVDAAGNVYLAGQSGSRDLPVTAGVFQTALAGLRNSFVAKVDIAAPGPAQERPLIERVRNFGDQSPPGGVPLPIGPGAIIRIEGEKLAGSTVEAAKIEEPRSTPLPPRIENVEVFAGGSRLPLFSISPERIVAQMLYGAREPRVDLSVVRGGQRSKTVEVPIRRSAPAIIVALKEDMTQITQSNTIRPGDTILLAVTGFGLTNPTISSGTPAPASPPYVVAEKMTAEMSPRPSVPPLPCEIQSFALAPGYVGIALARLKIPTEAGPPYLVWSIQLKTSDGQYSNPVEVFFPSPPS